MIPYILIFVIITLISAIVLYLFESHLVFVTSDNEIKLNIGNLILYSLLFSSIISIVILCVIANINKTNLTVTQPIITQPVITQPDIIPDAITQPDIIPDIIPDAINEITPVVVKPPLPSTYFI